MTVIECHGLTKSFGKVRALDHLSVTIRENKITGFIGRNGAGKTTLLKILAGYWRPTSGHVEVFGQAPYNDLFVSANSIFITDSMNFSDMLTLEQIMETAAGFYEKWDMSFAKRLFRYFGFEPQAIYENLSKGKKSTFNGLVGLASRCALTMFDEPTTGMDAAVRKDFYRALLKDYLAHPRTILLSSHHLPEVEHILEDVFLIEEGKERLHIGMDDLKEYAIGLTGLRESLEAWAQDKEIIYKRQLNERELYIVVKNEYSTDAIMELGFSLTSVSANDLCIYLTSKTKGGIDDVFNESQPS